LSVHYPEGQVPDYSQVIVLALIQALPWLVGGVVVAGVLGWSPLGRSLRRTTTGDDAAMREVHGELTAIRQELAEAQERLDYSERLLMAPKVDAPIQPVARRSLTPV
jgi:hypothetical protein